MAKSRKAQRRRSGGKIRPSDSPEIAKKTKKAKAFSNSIKDEALRQREWLSARKRAEYERKQRVLWSWAVTLAIVVSFYIFFTEIGAWLGAWNGADARQADMKEMANLMAILILGIDLAGKFRNSEDKLKFVRGNMLELVALIPIGLIFRMGQALESFSMLKNFAYLARAEGLVEAAPLINGLRNSELALMFERLANAFPQVGAAIGKYMVQGHAVFNNFATATQFLDDAARMVERLLRLR